MAAAHQLVSPAFPLDPARCSTQTQSWCSASRSLKPGLQRRTRWWARGRICAQGRPRPCCRGPTTAGPPPTSPSDPQLSHICNQKTLFLENSSSGHFVPRPKVDWTVKFNYPWPAVTAGQDAALTSNPSQFKSQLASNGRLPRQLVPNSNLVHSGLPPSLPNS